MTATTKYPRSEIMGLPVTESKKLTEKISPIINPYFMAAFNTFVCINYPLLFCHKNTKKYGESCNFLVTTTA
jgi:hypothetical protein